MNITKRRWTVRVTYSGFQLNEVHFDPPSLLTKAPAYQGGNCITPTCKKLYWLPLLVLGSGLIVGLNPTYAQQRLPQPPPPQIFDELPPPFPASPSSIPTFGVPSSPLPPASPDTVLPETPALPDTTPPEREYNFEAPSPSFSPRQSNLDSTFYRVDIYEGNPFVLSQVRQIEPQAFVRQGEGVIQAGVFADEYNARSRVRELAARGIRAQITPIGSGTEIGDIDTRVASSEQLASSRSYFVIIPGNPEDLGNIATEIVRFGVPQRAVSQRDAPRGPHVALGPFESRTDADRWSNFLRSTGMDARVFFGN